MQGVEKRDVLSKDLIFINQNEMDQMQVIQHIIQNAAQIGYVTNIAEVISAVKNREEQVSTAIGYQIAMPHGKTKAVQHPFIAFLRTNQLFLWSEKSDEKVNLIFLIGVPEESEGKLHLKFISQLSKKLLDEEFRKNLLEMNDTELIYNQLSSIEL